MAKSAALTKSEELVDALRLELDQTRTNLASEKDTVATLRSNLAQAKSELASSQDAIRHLADELAASVETVAFLRKQRPNYTHNELMAAKRLRAADLIAKYGVSNVRQIGGKFEVRISDVWGVPAP